MSDDPTRRSFLAGAGASLFINPFTRTAGANDRSLSGAKLYFFVSGTSMPVDTYTTSARTTPHTNPVVADGGGKFPRIWLNPVISYRSVLTTAGGVELGRVDPIDDPIVRTDLSTSSGAAAIGFLPSGTGAVARTVQDVLREWVSLKQFRQPADVDYTPAMARAVAHCALTGAGLRIPAGDYAYAESPNWAVENLVVQAEGRVRFFYTGAGNALIFDAGPDDDDLCNHVLFGNGNRIHLHASAAAQNGIYVRSVHHSYIGVNVHGCGAAYAGLLTEFAVCTTFDVVVSANEGGWHQNAKPGFGYLLSKRRGIQTTSYCYFPNPIVEGVATGIHLKHTLGNLFVGGTSEGCSNYGVLADTTAQWDRFIGTDFESNKIADVFCQGEGVEFISCDTYRNITLGSSAKRCVISGGGHEAIAVARGALGCSVLNAVYNRRRTGATFDDAGSGTEISNVRSGVAPYRQYLTGELAVDGSRLPYPGSSVENVNVPGAKPGDFFLVSCTASMASFDVAAHCNVAGMVTVRFANITGAPANRQACMIKVRGFRGS